MSSQSESFKAAVRIMNQPERQAWLAARVAEDQRVIAAMRELKSAQIKENAV